jgi:hypothetical protein
MQMHIQRHTDAKEGESGFKKRLRAHLCEFSNSRSKQRAIVSSNNKNNNTVPEEGEIVDEQQDEEEEFVSLPIRQTTETTASVNGNNVKIILWPPNR